MTDREKCEYILKLLNDTTFELNVRGASSLLASYKWLYSINEEMIEKEKKPVARKKQVKKKTGIK